MSYQSTEIVSALVTSFFFKERGRRGKKGSFGRTTPFLCVRIHEVGSIVVCWMPVSGTTFFSSYFRTGTLLHKSVHWLLCWRCECKQKKRCVASSPVGSWYKYCSKASFLTVFRKLQLYYWFGEKREEGLSRGFLRGKCKILQLWEKLSGYVLVNQMPSRAKSFMTVNVEDVLWLLTAFLIKKKTFTVSRVRSSVWSREEVLEKSFNESVSQSVRAHSIWATRSQ